MSSWGSIGVLCFGLAAMHTFAADSARAADQSATCDLKRVASLDAITDSGQLLIAVKLNGRDSWVRVDTGGPFNLINKGLADELKLHFQDMRAGAAFDGSGNSFKHFVKVHTLQLGGMSAEDVLFLVMGEDDQSKEGMDGTFGADFLASYDVELDLAHGKVNLFLQNRCDAPPVYWTRDYVSVPFKVDASLHAILPVTLDGQRLRAVLDTGATPSTLSAQVAKRLFGIDAAGDGLHPDGQERTGTGHTLPVYGHRFSELDIGGVVFHKTEFMIVPDKISRVIRSTNRPDVVAQSEQNMTFDMIVGLHHLGRIRAYIAYGERVLYISAADAK
jgi:predicted aspartyl protease